MRAFAAGGRPEVRAATERPRDGRNQGRYEQKPRFYSPHDYQAMLLTPGFTGLRLGELLALRRADFDGHSLSFRFSAHEGELVESSHEKNHERTVPVPPTQILARRRALTSTTRARPADLRLGGGRPPGRPRVV